MGWNPRVKVQFPMMGAGLGRSLGLEGRWTDHPDVPVLEFAKKYLKVVQGTSLVVQRLRLHVPKAGGAG